MEEAFFRDGQEEDDLLDTLHGTNTPSKSKVMSPGCTPTSVGESGVFVYIRPLNLASRDEQEAFVSEADLPASWRITNDSHILKFKLTRYTLCQVLIAAMFKPTDACDIVATVNKDIDARRLRHIALELLQRLVFSHVDPSVYPDEPFTQRFRTLCRFQASRGALVIFIFGSPCFKHSCLPTVLAEVLNVPNVVRTDVVANVLSFPTPAPTFPEGTTDDEMLTAYKQLCSTVRSGLGGDLDKAKMNGKSVIVEGLWIDPELYTTVFHSSETKTKYPVVVVPFMLISCRRSDTASATDDMPRASAFPSRSLDIVEEYLLGRCDHAIHTIAVDTPDPVRVMHRIVLDTLSQAEGKGVF